MAMDIPPSPYPPPPPANVFDFKEADLRCNSLHTITKYRESLFVQKTFFSILLSYSI